MKIRDGERLYGEIITFTCWTETPLRAMEITGLIMAMALADRFMHLKAAGHMKRKLSGYGICYCKKNCQQMLQFM